MKNRNLQHKNDWKTPDWLLQNVKKEFGEYFDPCPYMHDTDLWDGLYIDWKDVNFINPPYERLLKEKFIEKAYAEACKGSLCVMLLPVSTSTKIFHNIILPFAEIRFIKGRVSFSGYNGKGEYVTKSKGMHDSMFVIYHPFHKVIKGQP